MKGKMNGKMNKIDKKTISTLIMTMLMLSMAVAAMPMANAVPTTWYVDGTLGTDVAGHGTGTGVDAFKTIQYAIDAATAGDTISVAAGTYVENVVVDKSLTLVGDVDHPDTVIVENTPPPTDILSVFTVTVDDVEISGFTVISAEYWDPAPAGIYIEEDVSGCTISDNILTSGDQAIGIYMGKGSNNNILTRNDASDNLQGFEIILSDHNTFTDNIANDNTKYGFKAESSQHNTFTGNTANDNGRDGFRLSVGPDPEDTDFTGNNDNIFTDNTAHGNTQSGFRISGGTNNTLTGNTFDANTENGLLLMEDTDLYLGVITDLTVNENTITGNAIGISIPADVVVAASWEINYNDITGNTAGVENLGVGDLDATLNWWGDIHGPGGEGTGSGDTISTLVNYIPWLDATYESGEPTGIILDSEYYITGSNVTVTLYWADADPLRTETTTVDVVSTSDVVGIEADLTETGANTGIFTGTFLLVPSDTPEPKVYELGVDDGDIITVTYDTIPVTATVDDSPPTITDLTPPDESIETTATPIISATLTDGGSGIDEATIVMTVNGDEVGVDYAGGVVSYEPDLDDGLYTVTVNVDDMMGNHAEEASWSFTVNTAVSVTLTAPTDDHYITGDTHTVSATASITGGTIDSVTFSYKLAPGDWEDIGEDHTSPYSLLWDLTSLLDEADIQVRAVAVDDEANEATDTITITLDREDPTAPTVLGAVASPGVIVLSWTAATDDTSGVEYYNVYRGIATGDYADGIIGTATGTSYDDTTGTTGEEYFYVVTAVDSAGWEGDASNEDSAIYVPGAVYSVEVEADTNVLADGVEFSTITATVSDVYGNPIPDATVDFTTTLGTLSDTSAVTDADGEASVTLTSTLLGTATVTATVDSIHGHATVKFIGTGGIGDVLSLLTDPRFGLEEIKVEVIDILDMLGSETYGLSAIMDAVDLIKVDTTAILADTTTINWADITAIKGYVDTEIAAILADTATINWADITHIDAVVDAIRGGDVIASKQENDKTVIAGTPYTIGGLTASKVFKGTITLQIDTTLGSGKKLSVEVWDGDSWASIWTSSSNAKVGTSVSLTFAGKTTSTGDAIRIVTTATASRTFDYVFTYQIDLG